MPTFDITIQGKQYHVEIPDPRATPLQVIVDGQPFDVQVSGVQTPERPAKAPPHPAPRVSRPAPQPTVLLPGPNVKAAAPTTPAGANGGHTITSPMPGILLSIDVKVGDVVQPGQIVCVLEAMKMKNSIRASVSGTVSAILVSAGQAVAYEDVLVRLATGA